MAPCGGGLPPGGGFAPGGGGLLGSGCWANTKLAVLATKHANTNFDSFMNRLLVKNTRRINF
jgi:hypothetical protein